jgi:hypothetical protein
MSTSTDYVYVMHFDGDRIRHMTKIWNAGWAMKELGWGRLAVPSFIDALLETQSCREW